MIEDQFTVHHLNQYKQQEKNSFCPIMCITLSHAPKEQNNKNMLVYGINSIYCCCVCFSSMFHLVGTNLF